MSKDPNTNAPPSGGTLESLADQVYKPSLAEGNISVRRASPIVTLPVTILSYVFFGWVAWQLAKTSQAVQEAVKKTIGIDIAEQNQEEEPPPPPPPPPPAPAPAMAPPKAVEAKDAPPPPPLTNQEIVPEVAPKELPKTDLSQAYAGQAAGSGTGVPGMGVAGSTGAGMAVAGSTVSSGKVVDFDFSQVKIKYQPPAPPYPPLAKIAKIQGTVVVEITVGTDGIPVKATALEGPPQLRPAAENYAMQWKFEPMMLNGQPQVGRFKLTLPFKLR